MDEDPILAEVTKVTKHPVVEVAEGVQAGGFTVYAKMCVPAHKLFDRHLPGKNPGAGCTAVSPTRTGVIDGTRRVSVRLSRGGQRWDQVENFHFAIPASK